MRILYLHQYFRTPEEGGALRSYYLSQALLQAGHTVELITAWNGPAYKTLWVEGLKVHYLPIPYANKFGFLARLRAFLQFSYQSTKLAFSLPNPDLCFTTSTPLTIGLPAWLLKKFRGVPYYFEVRDLWPEAPVQLGFIRNPVLKKLLFWAEKVLYRNATKIIALSPGMVAGVKKQEKRVPVHLIPNLADCIYYQPVFRQRQHPSEPFHICYIGTLGKANRLAFLLEAAAALQRAGLEQVNFTLAGTGAEENALKEMAQKLQLKNVTFAGHLTRSQVQQLLQRADATYTSFDQIPVLETNSPNKFFDGLAAGKLSIVNTRGWLQELVEENNCGFYADPLNPGDFVARLRPFIQDPALLKSYQQNARHLAESQFSRTLLGQAFVQLF